MKPAPIKVPRRKDIFQFGRYLAVGVLNTLVTIIAIFVCKSFLGINPWVSNLIGYIVGVINSFVWNRLWVFNSHSEHWHAEGMRFLIGFGVCYCLQFAATWLLNTYVIKSDFLVTFHEFTLSGYGISTIAGMMVYTASNFFYNRLVTFRAPSTPCHGSV